ncbi:hypothetical protein SDC9_88269 [bioreactor metagenome]|uniref:Uncharacterized protein n=1 Tax=bioreactor metagenome TaxID=1076179 RepID=A0A644ZVK1_9ZZZZ
MQGIHQLGTDSCKTVIPGYFSFYDGGKHLYLLFTRLISRKRLKINRTWVVNKIGIVEGSTVNHHISLEIINVLPLKFSINTGSEVRILPLFNRYKRR